uniref:Uncharacterized protein n=1 Tax=Arundo donax TaxID=35708 RepID=A0A0A9FCR7_ARUDO
MLGRSPLDPYPGF